MASAAGVAPCVAVAAMLGASRCARGALRSGSGAGATRYAVLGNKPSRALRTLRSTEDVDVELDAVSTAVEVPRTSNLTRFPAGADRCAYRAKQN